MSDSKFTNTIRLFYDRWFNDKHEICYLCKEGIDISDHSLKIKQHNCKLADLYNASFYKFLKQYNYIVIHSIFFDYLIELKFIMKRLHKNVIWIEWGYDLYSIKYNKLPKRFFDKIKWRIDVFFKKNVYGLVCIFPPDIAFYNENYTHHNVRVFYAPYCGPEIPKYLLNYNSESRLDKTLKNREPIYIQVGHQGYQYINHFRTLEQLSRFKDENIVVVLPLSYGDANRIDQIVDYAYQIFDKTKIIVLKDFLPLEEYISILSRIDIAIFDSERQIGLGNISKLIFQNTKLFLTEGSIMYDYFIEQGVNIKPANRISEMTFEEFSSPVLPLDNNKFKSYIKKISSYQWQLDAWENIYNSL